MIDRGGETVQTLTLRRLIEQDSAGDEWYEIRGQRVHATPERDVSVTVGPVTGNWWDVPLPPCPDCGGDLVWWEAGYVPGARKCLGQPVGSTDDGRPEYDTDGGCGSLFSMEAQATETGPTTPDVDWCDGSDCGAFHRRDAGCTPLQDIAAHACQGCGEYTAGRDTYDGGLCGECATATETDRADHVEVTR